MFKYSAKIADILLHRYSWHLWEMLVFMFGTLPKKLIFCCTGILGSYGKCEYLCLSTLPKNLIFCCTGIPGSYGKCEYLCLSTLIK